MVILPPGSGKTRIAAEDASQYGARHVLYVAHTHEILDVAQSELEAVFGTREVVRHTKATSLTCRARANLVTLQLASQHLTKLPREGFDYLVIDEFHHAAAPSYRRLLEHLRPKFLLGLTATPFRSDRQDILQLCDNNVLVNYELRSGIEAGVLAPYHYFGCFDNVDYSQIRHNGLRYDVRDLERALIVPERDEGIVAKWKELAERKPTLAFTCSHRHAQRVAQRFRERGISAAPYLSDTPRGERAELLRQHSAGDITILCAVDVLNEGADFPHVECLLFLRPTESKRIFFQQLGRGLRRSVGKSHCIVIDFIGNFKNAYRIPEYQGLFPLDDEEAAQSVGHHRTAKEVLNLPLGCRVEFDTRVVELFERQVFDPRFATRHNIARILLYQYRRFADQLGRAPSRQEVDRSCLLGGEIYDLVFGSWARFRQIVDAE